MDINKAISSRKTKGVPNAGPMTQRQLLRAEYKYQRSQLINKGEKK